MEEYTYFTLFWFWRLILKDIQPATYVLGYIFGAFFCYKDD